MKKRKPAIVEKIYDSITGTTITSSQKINEILTMERAKILNIEVDKEYYNHPQLKEFYQSQWGDISNAIRRYTARVVIDIINKNLWAANPKYGNCPLRIRKITELMKIEKEREKKEIEYKEVEHVESYIDPKYVRAF